MQDRELRGLVLAELYSSRLKGFVPVPAQLPVPGATPIEIANVCRQLAELNMIEWKGFYNQGVGMARIKAQGVDVVEGKVQSPIAISLGNINVHGSSNVQIGNHNLQGVQLDIDKLNAAIDGSAATMEEKDEAKSLFAKLASNELLMGLLKKWLLGS